MKAVKIITKPMMVAVNIDFARLNNSGFPLAVSIKNPPIINIKAAIGKISLNKTKSIILSIKTKISQKVQGQQTVPQGTIPSVGQQVDILCPSGQLSGLQLA